MARFGPFLNVTDLDRSLAFYQALGFQVDDTFENDEGETLYADLSHEGAYLGLGSTAANDESDFQEWVTGPLGGGVLLSLEVDDPADVDAFHERAKKAGAVIEHPPTDRPYGRTFTFNDPDGYVLSVIAE